MVLGRRCRCPLTRSSIDDLPESASLCTEYSLVARKDAFNIAVQNLYYLGVDLLLLRNSDSALEPSSALSLYHHPSSGQFIKQQSHHMHPRRRSETHLTSPPICPSQSHFFDLWQEKLCATASFYQCPTENAEQHLVGLGLPVPGKMKDDLEEIVDE